MKPDQLDLYLRYNDVVLNDNTARTNKYNLPLGTFTVIDNNGSTRLIASALATGETTVDHTWMLQSLLKATGGVQPVVLFTDQDYALEVAIPDQLTETTHKCCLAYRLYQLSEKLESSCKKRLG